MKVILNQTSLNCRTEARPVAVAVTVAGRESKNQMMR